MTNEPPVIGSVTAANLDGGRYALHADGLWRGPARMIADLLNATCSPKEHVGTAALPPGTAAILAAADQVGDRSPQLPAHPPSEPGVIY